MASMFATLLEGPAEDWYYRLLRKTEAKHQQLTMQLVFDEFVRKYESGLSRSMAETQLNELTYGKGKCHDIFTTDAEFDRLVAMLYPNIDDDSDSMPLLARLYSDIFRRGDIALWSEAIRMQPQSVDDWRAAIQTAHTIQETIAGAAKQTGRGPPFSSRQSYPSHAVSVSFPSSTSSQRTPAVSVKQMQGKAALEDEKEETYTWERQEGESEAAAHSEQLQQVAVRKGPRGPSTGATGQGASGGNDRRQYGNHLTPEQRAALIKVGRCFNCVEKGHVASRCPSLEKPGYPRKPRVEQLNE